MTRAWIATALLAVSWLLGTDYLQPASYSIWLIAIVTAVVLLRDLRLRLPAPRSLTVALLLLLPTVWLMPMPYQQAPLLIVIGLMLLLAPIPRTWPGKLGRGAVVAGTILLAQSLTLWTYALVTARSHELPWPLAQLIGVVVRLLDVDVAVVGSTVAVRSIQQTHRIGATWELLLDPATACFLAGGLVLLALVGRNTFPRKNRFRQWLRSSLGLLAAALLWAPLRVAVLIALVLHRVLRTYAAASPNTADVFVSTAVHALLLGGLVVLAIRLTRPVGPSRSLALLSRVLPRSLALLSRVLPAFPARLWRAKLPVSQTEKRRPRAPLQLALVGVGVAMLVALIVWDPVGRPKSGRIMVVERHSTWEPTTVPYGTTVYGEAGSYNYAAVFDYCGQYFEMSRLLQSQRIDDPTLSRCDVLIIKTPTARYSREEVDAVERFVAGGGSLLLIGDHTNVFNMNTYLNDVARRFGFTFRNDLLFRVGDPYRQEYHPPVVPHPAVQYVQAMTFAVSCSIDPGFRPGRMLIRSTGLWNLPPAYQESNYHPQAEYQPEMRYGAWCQLWATRHGTGRVLAFADSTLFSNFCTFQPGKAELLTGMLQWLNHSSVFDQQVMRLLLVVPGMLLGVSLLLAGCWRSRHHDNAWLGLAVAGLTGWTVASITVLALNRQSMPHPVTNRRMVHVVIDRTLSEVPLHTGAFADGQQGEGYGMLEQWIPRIGNFTSRRVGDPSLTGDAVVIICPTRSVSPQFRDKLVRYVEAGGHLLVIDSVEVENSTANSVLRPFGLSSHHGAEEQPDGQLRLDLDCPEVPLNVACETLGGTAMAWLGERPVGAQVPFGRGLVTAIGFGPLFDDERMGFHWLAEPDEATRQRYEVLYAVLCAALPDRPRRTD